MIAIHHSRGHDLLAFYPTRSERPAASVEGYRHESLETIIEQYLRHYNQAGPHRSLDLEQPVLRTLPPTTARKITRRDVLGGMIHEYDVAA